jgi:hypothetical protein
LPRFGDEELADTSLEPEEQTTVLRAVRDPGGVRDSMAPPAPIRLAPKRALLAAMGTMVLLIQLWMFALARSHEEGPRSASPAEPESSSEPPLGAAPPRTPERVETELPPPEETTADPLRAPER